MRTLVAWAYAGKEGVSGKPVDQRQCERGTGASIRKGESNSL